MKNVEKKDDVCCQEETCQGVESCDCQGICTCLIDIDFDEIPDDCQNCCCDEDDDDDYDDEECDEEECD